jgi:two-component system, cell cycle sensor histidine kinase and response regulator CckA
LKRKTSPEDTTATGRLQSLRRQAEKIALDTPSGALGQLRSLAPADAMRVLHDLQVHQIELELQNEELRRTQDALEASRARYFDLYDLAPVGYLTVDEAGLVVEANLTGATLLGVARNALVRQPLSKFMEGADADVYYLHRQQLFRTGVPQAFELRLSRKGSVPFTAWIEATLASGDGGVPACRVVISDVTERKAIQEKLRRSQSLLQNAGEMALVGGWAIKLPENDLMWSDEICAILDFPKGTVPPLAEALSLYSPASNEIISRALRACARDGTPFDCELQIFTSKRRRLNVRAIGQAVRDDSGNIIGIDGAFQDITAQKNAEVAHESLQAQLRESQKMEALGTLAGGIAHDFNNILGTILGNAELARHDAAANWQALVSLDEIQKAGRRAKDLVQQILSFSRRQPTSRRVMSLAPIVEESVRLLRATLPGGLRIEYRCAPDIPSVVADSTQVQQVLLNLGSNAAHAMEGLSGSIDICVDGVVLDEATARFDLNLRPGRYARIVVADTGHGMDAATLRRVFEPFFTTKPVGKGTGLGLSVAHGIMQAHEGTIVAHSEPGRGSRFELYFPHAHAAAAVETIVTAGAVGEGRGQHILCIDDDEAQLFMLKRLLERWGYRVSAYIEQLDALQALLSGERFDLVVADYNMPGMSGLRVAQAIRDAQPDMPVIIVSGFINDELRAQADAIGIRGLVSKPLELEELRDAIQRLLEPPVTIGPHPG